MAHRVDEDLRGRDIVHLRCSPLEGAQETMETIAEALGQPVTTDGRVIEAAKPGGLKAPSRACCAAPSCGGFPQYPRPEWGEPYREIVAGCGWHADALTARRGTRP